ncbi:MAG: hypothetical protein ACRC56_12865, partial [Bosea sp. (in: a-proteobacteria)]
MSQSPSGGGGFRIRSPQDFGAGVFMIMLGIAALILGANLSMGTLRSIGPGMLPKSLAVICMVIGVVLCLNALRYSGPALESWSLKG